MFHQNTNRMIDYWQARAEGGRAPPRKAVEPADFRPLMHQVFIVGRDGAGNYPFRLVGGFVADLHQRDLRNTNVLSMWSAADQTRIKFALEGARKRPQPVVATAEACALGHSLELEVFFAPLAGVDSATDRFLGLYQPLSMVARLRGGPATELRLLNLRIPGVDEDLSPRLRLAAVDGRQVA